MKPEDINLSLINFNLNLIETTELMHDAASYYKERAFYLQDRLLTVLSKVVDLDKVVSKAPSNVSILLDQELITNKSIKDIDMWDTND